MATAQMSNANIGKAIIELTAIQGFRKVKKVGLINEKITLGVKNRIQKLIKELLKHYDPYNELYIELLKNSGGVDVEGIVTLPKEKQTEEFFAAKKELDEQMCELSFDPIDFKMIEPIESEDVYDFELLSPFFENYN